MRLLFSCAALLLLLLLLSSLSAPETWAAPRVKVLKLAVTNPTAQARAQENVVISVAALKRAAPDFKAGAFLVTTSDAATLEEDARTMQATELPSQANAPRRLAPRLKHAPRRCVAHLWRLLSARKLAVARRAQKELTIRFRWRRRASAREQEEEAAA